MVVAVKIGTCMEVHSDEEIKCTKGYRKQEHVQLKSAELTSHQRKV